MSVSYVPLHSDRVLALDPISRGFGFVVLEEDPLQLVDWGVVSCRKKNDPHCLLVIGRMLERFEPTVLVLEDPREARLLRHRTLSMFLDELADLLVGGSAAMRAYSRREIREAFASTGAVTKMEIATLLARRFPELTPKLPPVRQIWKSEDTRMSIFDALSLAITHLTTSREQLEQVS